MDDFLGKKYCDRCGSLLSGGRIMSMYNEACICMDCKDRETKRSDYATACEAERAEIMRGNYNFKGIGM